MKDIIHFSKINFLSSGIKINCIVIKEINGIPYKVPTTQTYPNYISNMFAADLDRLKIPAMMISELWNDAWDNYIDETFNYDTKLAIKNKHTDFAHLTDRAKITEMCFNGKSVQLSLGVMRYGKGFTTIKTQRVDVTCEFEFYGQLIELADRVYSHATKHVYGDEFATNMDIVKRYAKLHNEDISENATAEFYREKALSILSKEKSIVTKDSNPFEVEDDTNISEQEVDNKDFPKDGENLKVVPNDFGSEESDTETVKEENVEIIKEEEPITVVAEATTHEVVKEGENGQMEIPKSVTEQNNQFR